MIYLDTSIVLLIDVLITTIIQFHLSRKKTPKQGVIVASIINLIVISILFSLEVSIYDPTRDSAPLVVFCLPICLYGILIVTLNCIVYFNLSKKGINTDEK